MCVAAKNYGKFTKNLFLRGSRSFKVIDVDKNKKLVIVLVMISNMSVPICNRFHTRPLYEPITTKYRLLKGVPLFAALVRAEPSQPGARNFVAIN